MRLALAFLLLCQSALAADIYVAQTAQGGDTGADPANAHSIAWLNGTYTWTGDDTIHLCAVFTSTLHPPDNSGGSLGHPVTILFEIGAQFTKAYWGTGSGAAIYWIGMHDVVVDGGVNGLIWCVDNGMFRANSNSVEGINVTCNGGVEFKNLTMSNLYYRVSSTECNGTAVGMRVDTYAGTNILIHNNTIYDSSNPILLLYAGDWRNFQIYSNNLQRINQGLAAYAGASGNGYGMKVWANTMNHFENWDPLGGACAGSYHGDGVFFEPNQGCTNHGLLIYQNYIGPSIPAATAEIIVQSYGANMFPGCMIFNNFLVEGTNTVQVNRFIENETDVALMLNNTMVRQGAAGGTGIASTVGKSWNNLYYNITTVIAFPGDLDTNSFASDYNLAWNTDPDHGVYGFNVDTNYPGFNFRDFWTYWRNCPNQLGQCYDLHSLTNQPSLDVNYVPTSGDIYCRGNGTNLTSLANSLGVPELKMDFYGNTRPIVGPWTIGAFEGTTHTNNATASDFRVGTMHGK